MSKHTAGPWELIEGSIYGTSVGGVRLKSNQHLVAQIRGWGHLSYLPNGAEIQDANARLIAAAPELLEALKEICDCPQWIDEATVPEAGIEAAPQQVILIMSVALVRLRKAKAAIAKAEEQA